MTSTDDLLRDLTDDVDDATPMARSRIRGAVMRRIAPSPRPAWRRPRRLVPFAVAGAVAAVAAAALVVNTGGSGPSLVQRAEAAVAPPGEIVSITARFSSPGVSESPVVMRDWSLVGEDGSLRVHRVISSLPEGQAPDDEDSVVELNAAGEVTKSVSWLPDERLALDVARKDEPYANSWAGVLREAYRSGSLRDAGTEDGARVFVGTLPAMEGDLADGCTGQQRIAVDGATFEPRWVSTVATCDGKPPTEIGRITFRVERLPVTPQNLKLLRIGPWPVKVAVRVDADTGKETPVPVAEARREAGMD